ncbi:uncharacterized protein LOC117654072 isoform X1 [Thrips palmi]|uniref:Uncharacterized protein LOC117654072 isoform X1 n=1 Tax=Thrips palmi TaxID=161013 RepID=A0A6P9AD14_THRPL|nr:uncharacterized protein LOC117654072 isoform X1 [Thrips palmi]
MPVRPVRWARWARWDWAPLLVVLALFLLLGLLPAASPRRPSKDYKLVLRNLFLRNCPDTPDAYAKIDEATKIHLLRDGGQLIDVNFTVAKPVRSVRVVSMKINKCRDVVSHDTCEYFTTWSWKTGICNIIVMQNMVWSTLVEGIEPKLKCPIQAGNYSMHNGTFDVNNPMFRSVFEANVWTGVFSAIDQDDATFVCIEGGLQGIKVRAPSSAH